MIASEEVNKIKLVIQNIEIIDDRKYITDRRRLIRHPNSIRASTNQGRGREYILLSFRAATLPKIRCWQWWC